MTGPVEVEGKRCYVKLEKVEGLGHFLNLPNKSNECSQLENLTSSKDGLLDRSMAFDDIIHEMENMESLAYDATDDSVAVSCEEESVLRQIFNSLQVSQLVSYSDYEKSDCNEDVEVNMVEIIAAVGTPHDGKVCNELSTESQVDEQECTGAVKNEAVLIQEQDACQKIVSEASNLKSYACCVEKENLVEILGEESCKQDEETL